MTECSRRVEKFNTRPQRRSSRAQTVALKISTVLCTPNKNSTSRAVRNGVSRCFENPEFRCRLEKKKITEPQRHFSASDTVATQFDGVPCTPGFENSYRIEKSSFSQLPSPPLLSPPIVACTMLAASFQKPEIHRGLERAYRRATRNAINTSVPIVSARLLPRIFYTLRWKRLLKRRN